MSTSPPDDPRRFRTMPPPPPPGYSGTTGYRGPADASPITRTDSRAVFGQVMFLVAVTVGFLALGAWIGRDLSRGVAFACWAGAFALIMGMSFMRKAGHGQVGMAMLFGVGTLLGMSVGPAMAAYLSMPSGGTMVAQAAGLTALFIGAMGTFGYATKRDLSAVGRISFFALLGLIVVAIVAMFVSIPNFPVIFSVIGLVVFAGLTMWDFQRLRHAGEDDAVLIALSIFLDVFNVFLFILNLLGGSRN